MDTYSDFVQFSRDLCAYNTDIAFSQEDKEFLDSNVFLSCAVDVLDVFKDAFCDQFCKLYERNYSQVLDTEEQFFVYTIPRCLNLVDDNHYYFSLILVAAFIQELVCSIEELRNCFRFVGTANKCLLAVFKRRFEENFEKKGGWRGLETFIDGYADWKTQTKHSRLANFLTRGDYEHKRRVLRLIKESDTAQVEGFSLNEYELSLIAMDNQLSIEAEINKSIAESEDSPLQIESDVQKGNRVDDDISKSITPFENCVSNFPSKLPNSESSSHTDLLTESFDSKSPIINTSSGNEKLSNSNDCLKSEFNASIHAINKLIAESGNSAFQTEWDTQKDNRVDDNLFESVTLEGNCAPNFPSKPSNSESLSDSDSLWESSDSESSDSDTSCDNENLNYSNECSKLELSKSREDSLAKYRMCKYCNKMCYEYAKYFVRKHKDLNLDKASENK